MVRPIFADPKTDFVFQRIFGSEDHKTALLGLLNDLLELDDAHRIQSVSLLPPEQRPKVSELKYSIVDVKCVDLRGTTYVVEMQVLNVEAYEKRVMYNVAKAYTNQLAAGYIYPALNDVIGIASATSSCGRASRDTMSRCSAGGGCRSSTAGREGSPSSSWCSWSCPSMTGPSSPAAWWRSGRTSSARPRA